MVLYGTVPSNLAKRESIEIPVQRRYGLAWPLGSTFIGPYFNKASSSYLIRGQILQILQTKKGERVMLPDFGVGIDNYLFAPLTEDRSSELAHEVTTAIRKYAQNIEVLKLRFFQDDNLKGLGLPGIKIQLVVKSSDTNQTLDFEAVI